ncbi:MAG: DEAD/DEAH box helicase [Gammaproteobacteria bacterium]|nr:DEAD/DEAH box helicase [Gammaproteobacteria bacterium]
MNHFQSFNLPQPLLHSLEKLAFTEATPIQVSAIPPALEGKDILGSARTGTGKTAAFGIPLIAHLLANPTNCALILTPTRELATQVNKMLKELIYDMPIKTALLIGGEPIFKQFQQLRKHPRLVIGTPGRVNDHIDRRSLQLARTHFLVLDETDRMLDMGFSLQIDQIVEHLPAKRQTLLFSATLPGNIIKLAAKYMHEPVRVAVSADVITATGVKQDVVRLAERDKYQQLVTELTQREGSVIVFVKTKWGAEQMAHQLRSEKHSADAIHGDLRQRQRDKVIQGFRDSKYRIMVATDIAARGLDIAHVRHVINYDLPQSPEDYVHRIGRTARAGSEGFALSFVTPSERHKWQAIDRLINPNSRQTQDDSRSQPRSGSSYKSGSGSGASAGAGPKKKWFKTTDSRKKPAAFGDRPKSAYPNKSSCVKPSSSSSTRKIFRAST